MSRLENPSLMSPSLSHSSRVTVQNVSRALMPATAFLKSPARVAMSGKAMCNTRWKDWRSPASMFQGWVVVARTTRSLSLSLDNWLSSDRSSDVISFDADDGAESVSMRSMKTIEGRRCLAASNNSLADLLEC